MDNAPTTDKSANKASESTFFDNQYAENPRRSVGQIYSITRNRMASYEHHLYTDVAGLRVLEYGCGTGSYAFELAKNGADVVGIDISAVGIERAKEKAAERGLSDNTEFLVMDAEELTFPDADFDMVCGSGILHHLDMPVACKQLARVLKPSGRAVFMEPLGYNPAINAFRLVTPKLRTPDEHPFVYRDFKLLRQHFGKVECEYHHLTSFAAMAFLKTGIFFNTVEALDKFDRWLFRWVPGLGYLSWYAVLTLRDARR